MAAGLTGPALLFLGSNLLLPATPNDHRHRLADMAFSALSRQLHLPLALGVALDLILTVAIVAMRATDPGAEEL